MAVIPDEVIAKVKAHGRGLLSKWSPQQTILSHPVSPFTPGYSSHHADERCVYLGDWVVRYPWWSEQCDRVNHIWRTDVKQPLYFAAVLRSDLYNVGFVGRSAETNPLTQLDSRPSSMLPTNYSKFVPGRTA